MLTGNAGLIGNQITNWVRQHVCAVSKEHGKCKKVVIRHMSVEKKPTGDVHTVNLTTDPAYEGTEVADKVIIEIADAAQRDANDMKSGVQVYAVYAYYTSSDYCPRKLFRVAAEEEFDPEGGPSEPPTEKGIVQQLMRHNEINVKNSLVTMGFMFQTFQKEIEQQRAMNQHFLRQQIDQMLLTQEVMNDAHKRRIDERKADVEVSVFEGVFEHLKVVLPIIANKIMGKEVIPPQMNHELYMLASLLEGLSEEQQNVLRQMLSPQQLTLLAELLGKYEDKKRKLIGEDSETSEESDAGRSEDKNKIGIRKPPNRLLKMFESRGKLAARDTKVEVKDEVTRRMEEKAAKIRDQLRKVREVVSDDEK